MANNEQRVNFPGFTTTAHLDNEKVQVERGTLSYGGKNLIIDLVRSRKVVQFDGSFLPAKILCDDKEVWSYKMEGNFRGQVHLVKVGDEPAIALVSNKRLERVHSFEEIVLRKKINLKRKIRVKREAARILQLKYTLTSAEQTVAKKEVERKRQEEGEKRAERRLRREKRKEAIMRRPMVYVWTEDGKSRHGHPCVGTEWHSLDRHSYVVLVDAYDEQTGKHEGAHEAFRVEKAPGGGNPRKKNAVAVTDTKPTTPATEKEIPQPIRSIAIELEEGPFSVDVYPDMDTIQRARRAGLNGGSLVTFDAPNENGSFQILEVFEKNMVTVGEFMPIE